MIASRKIAICCLCRCSLDQAAPHAIVNSEFAHLDCADAYDAHDLGALETPELLGDWQKDYADAVGIPLVGEI